MRKLARAVDRRVERVGDLRDADAGLRAAVAAGLEVRVSALGGDDVGDVAAVDRSARVKEDDAGLDRDGPTLRVPAVGGDAGDVDLQRLRRSTHDRDDVAEAVAEVRGGLHDLPEGRPGGLGRDRHEIGAGALQGQALGDRQRVRADRAAALRVRCRDR